MVSKVNLKFNNQGISKKFLPLRVLVIGGFGFHLDNQIGGQKTSIQLLCAILNNRIFEIRKIDVIKGFKNSVKLTDLKNFISVSGSILKLNWNRKVDRTILFSAGGKSLVEKLIFANLGCLFGTKQFIFVRAELRPANTVLDKFYRLSSRALARRSISFVVQSESLKRGLLNSLGSGIDCHCIPNWTASSSIKADVERREKRYHELINVPGGIVRLIFVGWLVEAKGVVKLVHAVAMLPKTCRVECTIVGDGNQAAFVREEIRNLELEARVVVVGRLSRGSVLETLLRHDILILPSETEGMSNALIEAASSGLALVATKVGGVADFFVDNVSICFAERSPASLAEIILQLYTDRKRLVEISRAGRQAAIQNFGSHVGGYRVGKLLIEKVG